LPNQTTHLIEPGGLVVKSGVVDLTNDDRATILGALIWMEDKLRSDGRDKALTLWARRGKAAFATGGNEPAQTIPLNTPHDGL